MSTEVGMLSMPFFFPGLPGDLQKKKTFIEEAQSWH